MKKYQFYSLSESLATKIISKDFVEMREEYGEDFSRFDESVNEFRRSQHSSLTAPRPLRRKIIELFIDHLLSSGV
ncbi:hypothetical protein DERF_003392 [Dermatophagoides farinae]|uniref:Uncharacterized protein n=1 Tax=Dermatophagoides farinae TaxID=6954 RepID=A0A922LAI6_DERFA|nr:hypothetical protein DERF_003392 [Dermatophagoides farinae]